MLNVNLPKDIFIDCKAKIDYKKEIRIFVKSAIGSAKVVAPYHIPILPPELQEIVFAYHRGPVKDNYDLAMTELLIKANKLPRGPDNLNGEVYNDSKVDKRHSYVTGYVKMKEEDKTPAQKFPNDLHVYIVMHVRGQGEAQVLSIKKIPTKVRIARNHHFLPLNEERLPHLNQIIPVPNRLLFPPDESFCGKERFNCSGIMCSLGDLCCAIVLLLIPVGVILMLILLILYQENQL